VAVPEGEILVGWTYFGSSYRSSSWLDTLWKYLKEFRLAVHTLAIVTGVLIG
jgi:hypothetical protein